MRRVHAATTEASQLLKFDAICFALIFCYVFFWFLWILIPLPHGHRASRRSHGATHHCKGRWAKAMNILGFNVSAYSGSSSSFLKPKIVSLRISLDAVISETFPCLLTSFVLNNCFIHSKLFLWNHLWWLIFSRSFWPFWWSSLTWLSCRLTLGFNIYNPQLSCNPFPRIGPRHSPCSWWRSGHLRRTKCSQNVEWKLN